ncbi:hypothetical protein B7C42_06632 [Nocardia cerradoensis]|uniref:Uncharacterized protein n=1 Tax=Nocardia cerradoensis TaxID=85688 RepID=A0A231GX84_9NOCA|nr:hypothetical protein B7C42_06632 [Nocardia cerradoensis]
MSQVAPEDAAQVLCHVGNVYAGKGSGTCVIEWMFAPDAHE